MWHGDFFLGKVKFYWVRLLRGNGERSRGVCPISASQAAVQVEDVTVLQERSGILVQRHKIAGVERPIRPDKRMGRENGRMLVRNSFAGVAIDRISGTAVGTGGRVAARREHGAFRVGTTVASPGRRVVSV